MQIYADLRCLQDVHYAFRGIGCHAATLLRGGREFFARDVPWIGLTDSRLPELPAEYRELVDRTQTAFVTDRGDSSGVFLQLSPMTHEPARAARLVGRPDLFAAAIVYDFIPLDVSERYLVDPESVANYSARLGWLRCYDRYLAISRYSARRLQEVLGVAAADVEVTGVALRGAFEKMVRGGAELGEPPADLPSNYVLFVGGVDPRKNIDVVLAAHARLRDSLRELHLLVVGKYGDSSAAEGLRARYAAQGGDVSRLHLLPELTDEQLAQLYRHAACAVCSSRIEGFSLPVIEAVACGSPILVSDNEAHRELVSQPEAIFAPDDAEGLAAAIGRIAAQPALRAQLLAAQRPMTERFTSTAVCERFWLPIAREARRRELAARRTNGPASGDARPRIAILSPFPPDASGVADYTRRTVQALGRLADVDVYTDASSPTPTPEVRAFFPISARPFLAGCYDATLSVVGNSQFHTKIIELHQEFGGPCLNHDNRLAELIRWWKGPEHFRRLASDKLGREVSMRESRDWIANPGRLPSIFFDDILPTAKPLIVHSRGLQQRCRQEYGVDAAYLPFCCYRDFRADELTPAARLAARHALSIPDDQVAIVSLGFVAPQKAPDACVRAIALLQRAGIPAHLYLVGAAATDLRTSLQELARNEGVADAVHFSGDWVSEPDYRRYVLAADFGIQLRGHYFGGLSGAMLDCIAAGLVTVTNDELAEALEAPDTVLRVPDSLSAADVAAQLQEAYRQGRHRDRLTPVRETYLADHSFERYARELLDVLGVRHATTSVHRHPPATPMRFGQPTGVSGPKTP